MSDQTFTRRECLWNNAGPFYIIHDLDKRTNLSKKAMKLFMILRYYMLLISALIHNEPWTNWTWEHLYLFSLTEKKAAEGIVRKKQNKLKARRSHEQKKICITKDWLWINEEKEIINAKLYNSHYFCPCSSIQCAWFCIIFQKSFALFTTISLDLYIFFIFWVCFHNFDKVWSI